MNMWTKLAASFCVVVLLVGPAFAADEDIGASSTSTAQITLTIADVAQISGVGDLSVNYTGTGSVVTDDDDVCVYTNDSASTLNYTITATGNGGDTVGGATTFLVDDVIGAATYSVPFTVTWNTASGPAASTSNITAGQTLTGLSHANLNNFPCSDPRANFKVTFTETNILNQRRAGTYDGKLILVVAPDAAN